MGDVKRAARGHGTYTVRRPGSSSLGVAGLQDPKTKQLVVFYRLGESAYPHHPCSRHHRHHRHSECTAVAHDALQYMLVNRLSEITTTLRKSTSTSQRV